MKFRTQTISKILSRLNSWINKDKRKFKLCSGYTSEVDSIAKVFDATNVKEVSYSLFLKFLVDDIGITFRNKSNDSFTFQKNRSKITSYLQNPNNFEKHVGRKHKLLIKINKKTGSISAQPINNNDAIVSLSIGNLDKQSISSYESTYLKLLKNTKKTDPLLYKEILHNSINNLLNSVNERKNQYEKITSI